MCQPFVSSKIALLRAADIHPMLLPGLTRQSIVMRRRWTRRSSPRVTRRRGDRTSSRRALAHKNARATLLWGRFISFLTLVNPTWKPGDCRGAMA
jgi:hypothetical protein